MLLTKEVELTITGKYIKYFEDLGYEIPRRKNSAGRMTVPPDTKIKVKVEHLRITSRVRVTVKCDECEKEYDLAYCDYIKTLRNGIKYCDKCARRILFTGENNPSWNPNKTDEERADSRSNDEYTKLVNNVFIRDRYTCQCCGQYSKELEAHHMNSYDIHIDERYDINNMITLCHNCHANFHKKYGYGKNDKEQFLEWMNIATIELQYVDELLPCKEIYCIDDDIIYSSYKEVMKATGCSKGSIANVCNRCHLFLFDPNGFKNYSIQTNTLYGKKYIYLCDYEKASECDLQKLIKYINNAGSKRKVRCKELNMVFDSIKDAAQYVGMRIEAGISNCCRNKQRYAGKFNGIPLTWEYVDPDDNSFIL